MRRLFPAKFKLREWIFSLLAVAMAIVSRCFSWAAGLGAGGIWFLFTIAGTVFFVALAGSDRCFFTALFTGLLTTGLLTAMLIYTVFIRQESLRLEHAMMFPMFFVGFGVLPSAFAWLVTLVIRRLERVFRHDDHAAKPRG